MHIVELEVDEVESGRQGNLTADTVLDSSNVVMDAKRVLIGAGARALFYPTLLYNVVRNKIQAEFRWWDRVGEFILLGAVPFPTDVPCLKDLGVCGVITLNESYETLVPTSLYHAHDIDHLVIPTRDYCFAPSLSNIVKAVDFIHKNALCGRTTYVHCKAGRGRSTTVVICYLVQHKQMMPDDAYNYVRSIRPRVLLASSQRQAVQEYYHLMVKKAGVYHHRPSNLLMGFPGFPVALHPTLMTSILSTKIQEESGKKDSMAFDDGSVVVVTDSDLDGYDSSHKVNSEGSEIWADLSVVYRVRVASQAAVARISCMWLRCRAHQKILRESSLSIRTDHLGGINVDIHVY